MEIRVLGPLEVIDDLGRPVAVRGARLTTLLIALVVHEGSAVSEGRLSEILWGDDPPHGVNALHRQISTLRRVLGRSDAVVRRGGGYALGVDPDAVDAVRFEALAARGRAAIEIGDVAQAAECLRQALGLWRGDPLVEVADQFFAHGHRTRLTELRVATIEARIDAELALGRHGELVGELELLATTYPMREHLWAQLMLSLSRSGRQTEALRAYQSARAMLADQVGLEPSPELRALETAILRQDDVAVRRDVAPIPSPRRPTLRTPLTPLFGRRDELDTLAARLRRRRLVTLVGPGGVGKSRLALEAAREVLEREPADVWFVELAHVKDPDGVVSAIAATLGLPISIDAKIDLDRVVEFLCGRSTLVVVDNCEHVIDAAARAIQDLLELCPTIRILATSRERLGVPGEAVSPVPPLALADAVALFVERGCAVAPPSTLTAEGDVEWPLLQSICARLDCLPLAIELAASRLGSMPVCELAGGLDDRFRLLNRGARTAEPRQQTLRAVIDWSYDLLADDERRVLDRLSVFTGGCDLDAARAVCADDATGAHSVIELVTRLADKSLVTIDDTDGRVRCRMLQTLVEYGRDRLAACGDEARVRALHTHHYRDLALQSIAALRGEHQRHWLGAIGSNMGNLRAAFEDTLASGDAETACVVAGSLGWYWWFTGRAVEGSAWLTDARGHPGMTGGVTSARVDAWAAFVGAPGFVAWGETDQHAPRTPVRDGDDPVGLAERAMSRYREEGALEELAALETALSVTYTTRGSPARASELLADAERILAGLQPVPRVEAMLAYVCGRRAFVEDRYPEAVQAFTLSVPLLESIGGEVHASFALRYLGRLHAMGGDHDASMVAIEAALRLAEDLGLSGFANVLLTDLGASLAASGQLDRARRVLARPLASARDQRAAAGIGASLAALAWVEWQAGNPTGAADLVDEVTGSIDAGIDPEAVAHCHVIAGLAAERRGDLVAARSQLHRALDSAVDSGDPRCVALTLEARAAVAVRARDGLTAALLGGAASALRQSPGRASGWAFALVAPIETDELMRRATHLAGASAAAAAYDSGAADPEAVVARMANALPL